MQKRRGLKQAMPLVERLSQQAQQLRKEAKGLPPGGEREELVRKARQLESAVDVSHWLDKGITRLFRGPTRCRNTARLSWGRMASAGSCQSDLRE
jgi:hypothetical protein